MVNNKRISKSITKKNIFKMIEKMVGEEIGSEDFCPNDIVSVSRQLREDLQGVRFDIENFFIDKSDCGYEEQTNLIGFQTLESGLTFIGCVAGGDWEHYIFLIIYFDGEDLRAYIPVEGNIFNRKGKCAYGSEGCIDDFDKSNLKELFPTKITELDEFDNYELLSNKVKHWFDNVKFDWDKLKLDINNSLAYENKV